MKLREPAEFDFPPEQPGVVARMVRLHLDTFGYAAKEFAKLLRIHEKHLGEFYDLTAKPTVPGLKLRVVR
ncbi:MAG: hypothetical protein E6G97_11005 [Alphaproteobacteria bacterium]|nr:MAG: hypothetical protein E6G97_11005 [Alphaproteobacteria bacterium]